MDWDDILKSTLAKVGKTAQGFIDNANRASTKPLTGPQAQRNNLQSVRQTYQNVSNAISKTPVAQYARSTPIISMPKSVGLNTPPKPMRTPTIADMVPKMTSPQNLWQKVSKQNITPPQYGFVMPEFTVGDLVNRFKTGVQTANKQVLTAAGQDPELLRLTTKQRSGALTPQELTQLQALRDESARGMFNLVAGVGGGANKVNIIQKDAHKQILNNRQFFTNLLKRFDMELGEMAPPQGVQRADLSLVDDIAKGYKQLFGAKGRVPSLPEAIQDIRTVFREANQIQRLQNVKFNDPGMGLGIATPKTNTTELMSGAIKGKKSAENLLKVGQAQGDNLLRSSQDLANNLPSEGIIAQSVEASPQTLAKLNVQKQRIRTKSAQQLEQEWQEMVFDQTGARTVKGTVDDIARLIKDSTDRSQKAKFATSLKNGKIITNKANEALPRSILDRAAKWKDKPRLAYARERFDRNIQDIAGNDAPAIINRYFTPVQKAEASRMRWLNSERQQIAKFGIQGGSPESQALQMFGEKKMPINKLKQQLPNSWQKVVEANKFFRQKYDQYLKDINKVLERNGYDPIPKRDDYFIHFQDLSNVLERFGIPVKDNTLPTDIAGLTADFKPGKNFFSSALPRLGDMTDFDAIKGIDRYLEGASKQIFHTDNIQNLRLFEKGLRDRFAGTTHLSNFTADLGEYINNIAGKKSMIDRGAEALLGRNVYGAAQRLRSQVGANMVGANIASSVTNFIPLTQAMATTNKPSFMKGLMGALISPTRSDGFIDRSSFLTRRFGSDRLFMNKWDKIAEKGGLPFKWADRFVSEAIVRGKYHEGIAKGLSPEKAMSMADDFASRVIGDRSLGSQPTLFNSQVAGFFTQFQLEVNNQLSFLFKDIPRMNQGNKRAIASSLAQVALYSYLFNSVYEKAFGRRPAFDPIGVAQQAYEDFTNPDMKEGKALQNLVTNTSNQLPFASILTDGGRIPFTSAMPNPFNVVSGESNWGKELIKIPQFALPTGGSQVKKSLEGLNAFSKGASITPSDLVRYPIEQTPVNFLRTAIGGQYSTPEAREYFREGRTPLEENQSKVFNSLSPEGKSEYYSQVLGERGSEKIKVKLKENKGKIGTASELGLLYGIDKLGDEPNSAVAKAKWEKERMEIARNILNNAEELPEFSDEQKYTLYQELGVDPKDVTYYDLAMQENRIKSIAIREQLSQIMATSKDRQDIFNYLTQMRRDVLGEMVLSSGVIDDLIDEEIISKEEGKILKDLKFDESGQPKIKMSGRGKSAKVKNIKMVPMNISTGPSPLSSGGGEDIASLTPQQIRMPQVNLNVPNLTQGNDISLPQFRVKFNL